MKITRFRTVAVMYPHLSLEAEVQNNDGKLYYVNIDVNDRGESEELYEDGWWSYDKPLDQLNDANYEESIVTLDFTEVLQQMVAYWNENPVFIHDMTWKSWENKCGAGKLSGILFIHGKDDYGLWEGFSLSQEEENQIMEILMRHDTEGCSVRGTRKEIAAELTD